MPAVLVLEEFPRWTNRLARASPPSEGWEWQWQSSSIADPQADPRNVAAILWVPSCPYRTTEFQQIAARRPGLPVVVLADLNRETDHQLREWGVSSVLPYRIAPATVMQTLRNLTTEAARPVRVTVR